MRLEPVFLVAPKPKPPSIPKRRAFLIAGATFFVGLASGGACGYSIASSRSPDADSGGDKPTPVQDQKLPVTGDPELDELRRLATRASLDELVATRVHFAHSVSKTYRDDEFLWLGMERLAREVIGRESVPDRRLFSRWLAQIIENGDARFSANLLPLAAQLRTIR